MRAAIYVRQSLDRTGEGAAVDRQLAACRDLCDSRGWDVVETYCDNDRSASTGDRPEWSRLLAAVEHGAVDVIAAWHVDRLYRTMVDLEALIGFAERAGLRIATVTGDLDLSTDTGRMVGRILASVARGEVERKGARQVAANRARAQRGTVRWSRRPFGFERDGDEVRVVETEAEVLRKVAERVAAGETLAAESRRLNTAGVPTSLGNGWTVKTLKQVLLNPRVSGRVVYRGEDMGAGGPAILDVATHERLTALLTDPRRKYAPSTAVRHLLSGIALCGREGCDREPMLFTTNGPQRTPVYRCRRCYGARHRDAVDQVVLAVLAARLSRPDAVGLLSPDVDVSGLRAQAHELRERRDGLAALLADGLLTPDAVRVQARRLSEQISAHEREIDAATGSSPLAPVVGADDVAAALDALPLLDVREIVRALADVVILPAGKGVRFSPDQVRIEWRGAAA